LSPVRLPVPPPGRTFLSPHFSASATFLPHVLSGSGRRRVCHRVSSALCRPFRHPDECHATTS